MIAIVKKADHTRLHKLKRDARRQRIISAYEDYTKGVPRSMDRLLTEARDFAHTKIMHLERELKTTGYEGEDIDDWAQDVSIDVWQALRDGKFTPDTSKGHTPGEAFYSWLHKIAFNKASKVFNNIHDHLQTHTTVLVEVEDEHGKTEEVQNLEITNLDRGEETPYPILPEWINTRDPHDIAAAIIRLLSVENVNNVEVKTTDPTLARYFDNPDEATEWRYRGYSYTDIAAILNMSTSAVKQRVAKMKKRIKNEQVNPWGEVLPAAAD